MPRGLSNKVALITGAAQGIGRVNIGQHADQPNLLTVLPPEKYTMYQKERLGALDLTKFNY